MQKSFVIYNASAGSGKTYTLVKEYLKIILTAPEIDAYRSILAITFTNKAVHEMKSRIIDNLSEFTKDSPNKKTEDLMQELAIEINQSLLQIKNKSKQIIKHIIHNYAAFDISTIDKFTHKVIRAFAFDLGLQNNFEVTLETKNLLSEAVDALIAQAGEDEVLTKLLVDFTMEKTDDDKSWDISREILEVGKLILNENDRSVISNYKNKSIANFFELKNELNEKVKNIETKNSELAKEIIALIENNEIEINSFSRGHFPNHIHSIVDKKYNPIHKKYIFIEDIIINKNAKKKVLIESLTPTFIEILKEIYSNFEKRNLYKAFLKNITPVSLLNTLKKELDTIQTEQNLLSISEFNTIIYNEIQNQPAPFIYERLGERYRHFFIDEFQDTSEMQWRNLIPLIDNATSSEINGRKGSLMLVGDPKQSIYRWRGGKAEQLIELSKEYNPFNNPDKEIFNLEKNYRSYQTIIDFNNAFFEMLSNEFENVDYKDLYQNHCFQKGTNKEGGFVKISFIPKIDKDFEAENQEDSNEKSDLYLQMTLKTIQEVIKKGFNYNDIAILTRHNKNGTSIANFLIEEGLPVLSVDSLLIENASEVQAIIEFLRYIKNNQEVKSKAKFLEFLSRNFVEKIPQHDFIFQGLKKEEKELEEWLQEYGICISFSEIKKKSLFEGVSLIVSKIFEPFFVETNAYVHYFLDIILERETQNQSSISDFISYWDEMSSKFKIPAPLGSNAIQIMSIHKSKGLEFPVVIFPFAEENYSIQKKDKLWIDFEEEEFDLQKVLIDNKKEVEQYGENAKKTFNEKSQEQLLDNINVLYVALTRAEEQLYIISSQVTPNKEGVLPKTMASFFIHLLMHKNAYDSNQFEYEFGTSEKKSLENKKLDEFKKIPSLPNKLKPKNIRIALKDSLMWGTNQKKAIEYGTIIHEILSTISTKKDLDKAINLAKENGLIKLNEEKEIHKSLGNIINHPELSDYFDEKNEILNEQTIIQKEGAAIKPDRMVINKKSEILVLDYKTGKFSEKHKLQVNHYQSIIEKMGFKVIRKTLVYLNEEATILEI